MKQIVYILFICILSMSRLHADEVFDRVDELYNARIMQHLAPVISVKMGSKLDESLAYQLQTDVNKRLLNNNFPAGFKAGLTTKPAQEKFKVEGPVAGVLLKKPLMAAHSPQLVLNSYHRMMIEMELGFRFKQSVKNRIVDIEALKLLISEVLPVIELPDLGFDQPKQLQGVDIIANNVIAKQFIIAKGKPIDEININLIQTKLYHNSTNLLIAKSGEVMNDQWQALLWLVNRMLDNGWTIEPGQVLITGAIGKMLPAQLGSYKATFSALGNIEFTVVEE